MRTDVLILGGGPSGVAAAVGAARLGVETLLVERYGFLGGGATAALVNPFMTYSSGGKQIIHGFLDDLLKELGQLEGVDEAGSSFSAEAFKFAADRLCQRAGAKILFHSVLSDVELSEEDQAKVSSLKLASKGGRLEVEAPLFVDCTGDADLAYAAGAPCEKGRKEDGLCQPMTLNFRVGGVDRDRTPSGEEITKLYKRAKEEGRLDCPREDVLFFSTLREDVIHFNTTRIVKKDATDIAQLSAAELEGRRQAWAIWEFLREEVPGFEDSYLERTAAQIGVRESRRVMGHYLLTAEDCLEAKKFSDGIVRASYNIDIHNPTGEGTVLKKIPEGDWYEVPYRSLVPKRPSNLLVGGRPISATHEAHSSLRVMPIVMGIGQAAGVAAALSVKGGCEPIEVEPKRLKEKLNEQGAQL